MLSAALSRLHVLPPLVVFSKTPLPPAAQASSYIIENNQYTYEYVKNLK